MLGDPIKLRRIAMEIRKEESFHFRSKITKLGHGCEYSPPPS